MPAFRKLVKRPLYRGCPSPPTSEKLPILALNEKSVPKNLRILLISFWLESYLQSKNPSYILTIEIIENYLGKLALFSNYNCKIGQM